MSTPTGDFSNKPFNKEMAYDDPIKQYEGGLKEAVEVKY